MPDRTLPLAKLSDVQQTESRDRDLDDLPRSCPRNADGLHCVYLDALNPTRCIYCGGEFSL